MEAPDFRLIPAAAFRMGNPNGRKDEQPSRIVQLQAFRAARTPVTNDEYDKFVAARHRPVSEFRNDPRFSAYGQPAVGVSWFDAVAYCQWLTAETGTQCRLPTEAEREFAALGGLSGTDWPWWQTAPADLPNLQEVAELDQPHEPTEGCANAYGLLCMAENVHEWCSDWYARDAYATPHVEIPGGPTEGSRKVCRGGSWRHSVKFTRVTARASLSPSFRYNDFGFRVYSDA